MKIIENFKQTGLNLKNKLGKRFQILLAGLLSVVVLIIFFSGTTKKVEEKETDKTKEENLSMSNFILDTENRLETILSSIKGAGKVDVFVMANESTRFIYASDKDEKITSSDGTKTETTNSTIVLSKDGTKTLPIVEVELYPEIVGVLVVAEGAGDEKRRLMLLNAVSVALGIENSKIEVLVGENH